MSVGVVVVVVLEAAVVTLAVAVVVLVVVATCINDALQQIKLVSTVAYQLTAAASKYYVFVTSDCVVFCRRPRTSRWS